ncbi:MAG: HlyD family efflux transporter periplasmic adaptor subunit [Deltaproteobacteria bacterium]|nr:MAG: HlyD family efflux transporter periplasmic adaptor subunit [Deltaproteobacteria bacterium]
MSIAFSRSLRSMQSDHPGRWIRWLVGALVLGGVWGIWFVGSRVKVVAVTPAAKLDVIRSTYPLETSVDGRVIVSHLRLGRKVKAGEVLVLLDDTKAKLLLQEAETQQQATAQRLAALQAQIRAEKVALYREKLSAQNAVQESKLQVKAADLSARLAAEQKRRDQRLFRKGHLAKATYQQSRTNAQRTRALAGAMRLKFRGLALQQREKESRYRARLAQLQREVAALKGQEAIQVATCKRLKHELQDYKIVAPSGGHLGSVVELPKGTWVTKGKKIGTLIARGNVKVIASFAPADALGKVKQGQLGQLRLNGFPWVQYGSIQAKVHHVASVPDQGRIRVELNVLNAKSTKMPLKHGMPGALEIELERVSPATLLLRAVGKWLTSRPSQPAPSADKTDSPS